MKSRSRTIQFALALALMAKAAPVLAQEQPAHIAPDVLAYMQKQCASVQGTLQDPASSLTTIDLNADGKPDYVLNMQALDCNQGPGLWGGSGGGEVDVFISSGTHYTLAWQQMAFGAKVEGTPGALWVGLGGTFCGQKAPAESRALEENCDRQVVWNKKAKKLVLGEKRPGTMG